MNNTTKGGQVESDVKAKWCVKTVFTKGGQVESALKAALGYPVPSLLAKNLVPINACPCILYLDSAF